MYLSPMCGVRHIHRIMMMREEPTMIARPVTAKRAVGEEEESDALGAAVGEASPGMVGSIQNPTP